MAIQTYIHPGRLTAGTYNHHPFRKENDLNQTSISDVFEEKWDQVDAVMSHVRSCL